MMIVRDLTIKKTEYKGHPCHAIGAFCPCRPCYNAHDCTPPNRAYSKKVYSDTFHCASNWNTGCPQPKPEPTIEITIDDKNLSVNGNYKQGLIGEFMGEYTYKARDGKKTITAMKGQEIVNCGGGVYIAL